MLYILDSSFDQWDDLVAEARPIEGADMCYICDGGPPDYLLSVRGDGLAVCYADNGVLRLGLNQVRWFSKMFLVDVEDRFHLVMQGVQIDAFQMVIDRLLEVFEDDGIEYLWDIPEAIDRLERHDPVLAGYLRRAKPFPFVRDSDFSVWPFLRLDGGAMVSIHLLDRR